MRKSCKVWQRLVEYWKSYKRSKSARAIFGPNFWVFRRVFVLQFSNNQICQVWRLVRELGAFGVRGGLRSRFLVLTKRMAPLGTRMSILGDTDSLNLRSKERTLQVQGQTTHYCISKWRGKSFIDMLYSYNLCHSLYQYPVLLHGTEKSTM